MYTRGIMVLYKRIPITLIYIYRQLHISLLGNFQL